MEYFKPSFKIVTQTGFIIINEMLAFICIAFTKQNPLIDLNYIINLRCNIDKGRS